MDIEYFYLNSPTLIVLCLYQTNIKYNQTIEKINYMKIFNLMKMIIIKI